jgi:heterodisulfide reductase subunit B
MSRYLYYPGCCMDASARQYSESLGPVCQTLGIELAEINDWNCCGATEYVSLSTTPAYALIARNLAIAASEQKADEALVAPCSCCYLNLAKADHYMGQKRSLNSHVNEALAAGGLHYDPGSVKVHHLLEVIVNDAGLDRVRAAVKKPLTGLKVAPYLGCMVSRPGLIRSPSGELEQIRDLDRLLTALGAEVVDYPLRTECCGGHMSQVEPNLGLELIRRLVSEAERLDAVMMVTVCPMCQINIDAYQGEMNAKFHTHYRMPIVFFTQLMAVAFGMDPQRAGIGREVTHLPKEVAAVLKAAPSEAMVGAGTAAATAVVAAPHQPRRDSKCALPMPRMPEDELDR